MACGARLLAQCDTEGPFTMSAAENKRLMQHVFAELGKGNSAPYVEAMADDFTWIALGSTTWSGVYAGKTAVLNELFASLRAEMEGRIKTIPHRFTAEGDIVVVEACGDNMTKAGKPYRNTYCMVCRLEGGKLCEVTEYMDTELVTKVLAAPKHPPQPLPKRA
jgi:ketosteroid isomerase-like protein